MSLFWAKKKKFVFLHSQLFLSSFEPRGFLVCHLRFCTLFENQFWVHMSPFEPTNLLRLSNSFEPWWDLEPLWFWVHMSPFGELLVHQISFGKQNVCSPQGSQQSLRFLLSIFEQLWWFWVHLSSFRELWNPKSSFGQLILCSLRISLLSQQILRFLFSIFELFWALMRSFEPLWFWVHMSPFKQLWRPKSSFGHQNLCS